MANVILRVKREDGSWAEIPALVGPEGPQGVSIDDIVLKSQEGGVSTYSILLSDGSEKTFQVTDGAIITDVSLTNTDVLIDTYKISTSDGSFFNFKVTNGKGIKSIAKTSTDVLSDTYTISYNDNTTSTYTITNGRGIDYIEKDETIGLSDRYTIHYNDGSTSYYYVTNGEAGPAGGIGNRIYLSGLVDKVNDEEGYKRVKELKESKFDLSKFTVVGTPTITDDGVASGISASNYLTFPLNINPQNTLKIQIEGVHGDTQTSAGTLFHISDGTTSLTLYRNRTSKMSGEVGSTSKTYLNDSKVTTNGARYKYVVSFDIVTNKYSYQYYENDVLITQKDNILISVLANMNWSNITIGNIGRQYSPLNGSIDLKSLSITVDGKEVFSGNKTGLDVINNVEIPYTLSKTGSKIVDAVYRDRVEDCYNQYGTGNYYLFSNATEQFALPMPDMYGLIENLKLDITAIEGADW